MSETNQPRIGDTITVELNSGKIMTGTFDIHMLAGECVLNQHGFPFNFKRVLSEVPDGQS